jgi:hypothetical protein
MAVKRKFKFKLTIKDIEFPQIDIRQILNLDDFQLISGLSMCITQSFDFRCTREPE